MEVMIEPRRRRAATVCFHAQVAVGGIVVHNNWQYTSARAAVVDFRRDRGLEHLPLHLVDGNAMAWIKEA